MQKQLLHEPKKYQGLPVVVFQPVCHMRSCDCTVMGCEVDCRQLQLSCLWRRRLSPQGNPSTLLMSAGAFQRRPMMGFDVLFRPSRVGSSLHEVCRVWCCEGLALNTVNTVCLPAWMLFICKRCAVHQCNLLPLSCCPLLAGRYSACKNTRRAPAYSTGCKRNGMCCMAELSPGALRL